MSEAVELATAYVNLVPSFSGIQGAITKGLGGPTEKAAADVGKRAGKGMGSSLASGLKVAIGPVAAILGAAAVGGLLRESFAEAREAQKVGATTEQIIRSTGGAAKVTAADVGALTSSISAKAGVDDEAIQKGANLLLTFKNVRNEAGEGANVFDRATQSAVDLSAAGFGSVEGSSKMLGKALNDPVKGISALGRAGVTFTDQQKEQIKVMAASGDSLGAQKIILGEVESQVGGVAAASATMGEKAGVAFGNLKEDIGTRLLPVADALFALVLEKGIPAVESLVGWIADDLVPAVGAAATNVQAFGQYLYDNRDTIILVGGIITGVLLPAIIGAGVQATISAGKQVAGWLITQGAAVRSSAVQFASYYRIIAAGVVAGARAVVSGAIIVGQWIAMQAAALASSAITVASNIRAAGSFVLQRVAMAAGVIAMVAVRAATIAFTAVQWLMNAALSANPIGLVVIAVALLIAGIVLLWKNSETFRRIVLAVWAAVKGAVLFAIKALVNAAVGLAAWFVKTWKAGVELKDRLIAAFIAAYVRIVATVLTLRDKVIGFFTGLRDTAVARALSLRDKVIAYITGLRDTTVARVLNLRDKVVGFFTGLRDTTIARVLNLRNRVVAYITELRDATIRGVLVLRDKVIGFFTGLRDTAVARTLSLRDRVVGYVTGLRDTAISRVLNLRDKVIGVFTGMRDSTVARATELRDRIVSRIVSLAADMTKKANLVKNNVLAPFRLLRDQAGEIFRKVRDAAGVAFDQLRDKVKSPIRFVINTVINDGLIAGFNKLAGFVKLPELPRVPLPPGFHEGGYTGRLAAKAIAGVVHGDEQVIQSKSRRKIEAAHPGVMDHMNLLGEIPGYFAGGIVGGSGRFSPLFESRLLLASKTAGEGIQAFQRGFRPSTSYSGTSHQGDAIDLQVSQRLIAALRSVGIPTWDRTGKGNWAPHAHGVPLPGAGYAAGSAVWQAQDYLRGGDGLGGRDNGPNVPARSVPAGSGLGDLLNPAKLINAMLGKLDEITGSPFGQVVAGVPKALAKGMVSKVTDLLGFANGTLSAPAGIAEVGERGAELVMGRQVKNFRGGEQVVPLTGAAGRVSSSPMRISGTLDLGNGLRGFVEGVLEDTVTTAGEAF